MRKLIYILSLCTTICNAQTGDTLGDLNPAKFGKDFSSYDRNTALYMGQISELAYAKHKNKFDDFLSRYMSLYSNVALRTEFVNEKSKGTDTQVLLWGMPEFLVLGFRGTVKNFRNILTDL